MINARIVEAGLGAQEPPKPWVTCGRRPGKNFLTFCSIGRVRSRVRPVCAAGMAAGPNALRGSGPKQNGALLAALTQAGSPNPRNNRICITSSCPRQLMLPIYLLACLMLPAIVSAPCISRRGPSWPRPSAQSCWRARRPPPWLADALLIGRARDASAFRACARSG
jgi:hypothetical protein